MEPVEWNSSIFKVLLDLARLTGLELPPEKWCPNREVALKYWGDKLNWTSELYSVTEITAEETRLIADAWEAWCALTEEQRQSLIEANYDLKNYPRVIRRAKCGAPQLAKYIEVFRDAPFGFDFVPDRTARPKKETTVMLTRRSA